MSYNVKTENLLEAGIVVLLYKVPNFTQSEMYSLEVPGGSVINFIDENFGNGDIYRKYNFLCDVVKKTARIDAIELDPLIGQELYQAILRREGKGGEA